MSSPRRDGTPPAQTVRLFDAKSPSFAAEKAARAARSGARRLVDAFKIALLQWRYLMKGLRVSSKALALLLIVGLSALFTAAEQLPLPIDAATKAGEPTYVAVSSDLLGDRGTWTRTSHADLDGDGDYDMVVGFDTASNIGRVEYWRNDGNRSSPNFTLAVGNLIGDYSRFATPAFTDWNKDGLFDLIVGYYDGVSRLWLNTGTQGAPQFTYHHTIFGYGNGARVSPSVVDYDNDGHNDIVFGRAATDVRLFINDVDNSALDLRAFGAGDVGAYSAVALVDIDADGDLDVFTGGQDGRVLYFRNIGSAAAERYALEQRVFTTNLHSDPTFGDVDSDGDQDMIVGNINGQLEWRRNDGTASNPFWALAAAASVGFDVLDAGDYSAPALIDMNGDGDLDILSGNQVGVVSYYRNNGTNTSPYWTFDSTLTGDVGDNSQLALGDLDADGDLDLLVGSRVPSGSSGSGRITPFWNEGTPSVPAFVQGTNIDLSYDFINPALGDMDADGDLDLRLGAGGLGGWIVEENNLGNATNHSFNNDRSMWWDNWWRRSDATFADLDADGDKEMLVGQEDGYFYLYRNDGTASLPSWVGQGYMFIDQGSRTTPDFVDLNGDGYMDVAWGYANSGFVHLFRNDFAASGVDFDQVYTNYFGASSGPYVNPDFKDMDADGDLDALVGDSNGIVHYWRNDGTFLSPVWTQVNGNVLGDIGDWAAPALGDLDADGDYDLLIGNANNDRVRYYRNNGTNASFSFQLVTTDLFGAQCVPGGWVYCDPTIVDLNGDGKLDIVVGNYYGHVSFWRNDGSPTVPVFAHDRYLLGDTWDYSSPSMLDLDGDGDLDMLVGNSNGFTSYYKNNGTIINPQYTLVYSNFGNPGDAGYQFFPVVSDHTKTATADLDGDGDLDAVLGTNPGLFQAWQNVGHFPNASQQVDNPRHVYAGTVMNTYCWPGIDRGSNPEFIDLDHDGDKDLMCMNDYEGLYYWRNDGSPTNFAFAPIAAILQFNDYQYHSPAMGDLDGDGDEDLLIGRADGLIFYYKNVGTQANPAQFTYIYRGENGNQYLPQTTNGWARLKLVDIDNDGQQDVYFAQEVGPENNGDLAFLENRGLIADIERQFDDPTFIDFGAIFTDPSSLNYNRPSPVDIDGDADFDLIVGAEGEIIRFWRNVGVPGAPSWTLVGSLLDLPDQYADASPVDTDGDGDFDLIFGDSSGFVRHYRNTGVYATATTVILRNTTGSGVAGANVRFFDGDTQVCDQNTGTDGKASCALPFAARRGRIEVTGTRAGSIYLGIFSSETFGKTSMVLSNPSTAFSLDLERLDFSAFGTANQPTQMRFEVADRGTTVFRESTRNGAVDGYFPRKYLANLQEPFSQNRVTYDITALPNSDYASTLLLPEIYAPNTVSIGGASDSARFQKLVAAREFASDSQYPVYLVYPALTAQRGYDVGDAIPPEFEFASEVRVEYLGNSCTVAQPGGDAYAFNASAAGCGFLSLPVETTGDYLRVSYRVKAPPLEYFLNASVNASNFTFPAASLNLVS